MDIDIGDDLIGRVLRLYAPETKGVRRALRVGFSMP